MDQRYFSQLSSPRKALVRLCQTTNYGYIRDLEVRNSDPVFSPPPLVILDVKLDTDEKRREEVELSDFALSAEVCRLLAQLDKIKNGTIERIDVREGIPRRVFFASPLIAALHRPST
jgi:hypothetical protein